MSLNPTQTLICHLCGQSYRENEGHTKESCFGIILEHIHSLEDQLAKWDNNYSRAEKEYKNG